MDIRKLIGSRKYKSMKDVRYLTEQKLIDFCVSLWPNDRYTTNKTIKNIPLNARPDYVNLDKKIIVEYDGHRHYTQMKVILSDQNKDNIWSDHGYHVIRWPYFVQLAPNSIFEYFGKYLSEEELAEYDLYEQTYSHGFIDDKVILPADFCLAGFRRFCSEMNRIQFCPSIGKEVYGSLAMRIEDWGEDARLVWPSHNTAKDVCVYVMSMTDGEDNFRHNYT